MPTVALFELIGASVHDTTGTVRRRVCEIAVAPEDHPTRVAFLIVRTSGGAPGTSHRDHVLRRDGQDGERRRRVDALLRVS
jgi:hypothetical protein